MKYSKKSEERARRVRYSPLHRLFCKRLVVIRLPFQASPFFNNTIIRFP
nr:MAG TPA: hypothetical protein [Caudoviricetes sp.]DAI47507.1 MAG TPA: hypothetical protein [Caudoviricetes sp.]